jgi:hypothetical protein
MLCKFLEKKAVNILLILLIVSSNMQGSRESYTLLFDLSEVLFTTSRKGMFDELGWTATIWYLTRGGSQKNLEHATFRALSLMGKQKGKESELVLSPEGDKLPLVMCEWLAGKKDGASIIKAAGSCLEDADSRGYFANGTEKELAGRVIEAIFDPTKLAKNTVAISGAEDLLYDCVAERDAQGNRKHRMLVDANWDSASFNLLSQSSHGHKVLRYFKSGDVVISGQTGILRPQARAFENVIKRYHLDPARCVVVSAQSEMLDAARRAGMLVVHVRNQDLSEVRREFRRLGILGA